MSQRRGQLDSKSLASREHLASLIGRHVQIVGIGMPGFGVSVKIHESECWR